MYEEHVVAYLDMLGVKEFVLQNENDFNAVDKIYQDFDHAVKFGLERSLFLLRPKPEQDIKLDAEKVRVVYFSDCIVWSYPTKDMGQREYFIFLMALRDFMFGIQNQLYYKGIALRGGVSIGNFYLNQNKIFGSALVKAYLLEQKAVYPRILLEKQLIEKLHPNHAKMVTVYDFISEKDFFYFDYFSNVKIAIKMKDDHDPKIRGYVFSAFIDPVVTVINKGIRHPKEEVRKKYYWLRDQLLSIENLDYDLKDLDKT